MTAPAYRADGRPVGRADFYALACDPQRSCVVEACAGAGKTWMLVSRILRALLEGAQPHEILAITFTRKAAGEMRERLAQWLREFAAPGSTHEQRVQALRDRGLPPARAAELAPVLAGLHERVLAVGRPVEIRTFHAWFSQLLRAAPLELLDELGLQSDMELLEDPQEHRTEVFNRFHAALLNDPALRADHAQLIAERGRAVARKWLEAAWNKRVEFELADEAGVLEGSVPPAAAVWPQLQGLAHPAQALQTAPWRSTLRELALALGRGGAKAQDAATGLVMAMEAADAQGAFANAWGALFTNTGSPRKLGTVAGLVDVQDQLALLAQQIRQHEAHVEHGRMVRLARVLLAEYAAYKRSRGLADMADLERVALLLLRDATLAGWVQERLDARLRHVLIDEFQDTSPLQWHALHAWLSAYAGAGGGASGQRPPGVFIVGDPKQSIYRFRRAEPRVFEAAREFVVEALSGTLLECDHTRRNAPELVAALNSVFDDAQAQQEFSGFRPHTTEVAASGEPAVWALPAVPRPPKSAAAEAGAAWRDSLLTPRVEAEALLREEEARRVARAAHGLIASGQAAAGEVYVLCRKRQSLRLVAQALRDRHLPNAAAEEFALMERPEARDLVAVLDALVSRRHHLSLAQALRSPLFGASDDDLIALARGAADHGGSWWRALRQLDAPSPALARARALLDEWADAATRLPPHDLLDRIVAEGAYRERVAAAVPPEQRLAAQGAIDALLALALTLDGARYATPYNFVRALKRRAVRAAAPAQADAVQLLTVHGAKGLEADVVFVMDTEPEAKNADTATLLVDWPVDSERPQRCAFVYSESLCPPSLATLLEEELQARRREELNGLYVAMTRARRRLVISATRAHRAPPGRSWWHRLHGLAQAWQPGEAAGGVPAASAPARLKVLPSLAQAPRVAAPTVAVDTDATRLGRAVHRVLEWLSNGGDSAAIAELAAAAAAEFQATPSEAARLAATIHASPACARFFRGGALRWAANELPVADAGELLRIDRLVMLEEGGAPVWWVLDYKLAHAPQRSAEEREQLLRYRAVVRRLQPGALVRCAFITGAGAVVEVE